MAASPGAVGVDPLITVRPKEQYEALQARRARDEIVEPIVGGIKAHDLPECSYADSESLEAAITDGFTQAEDRLRQRCTNQPGKAA